MSTLKDQYDVHITASYYCPHHPEAVVSAYRVDCNCRKPKLGLFERAIKDFDIDLSRSYAIGDKLRDLAICGRQESLSGINNGCKGFLVGNKESDDVINRVKVQAEVPKTLSVLNFQSNILISPEHHRQWPSYSHIYPIFPEKESDTFITSFGISLKYQESAFFWYIIFI